LVIPRPCIDMQTVGYNVEWSQELKLEQSLEEYVKGSMLLEILIASGKLDLAPGWEHFLFDMSVGYDLKGIQTDRVQEFLRGMKDCGEVVERLRPQIPDEFRQYRDLDFHTRLSDTLTLSTFHGCPPDEIEKMLTWLIQEHGLHVIVKLNPTLLGKSEARRIFHDVLGYEDVIPDAAFEKDTKWEQAVDFVGRLGPLASRYGCRFGVKFSNTLIVQNRRSFFPATEKEMYLSGPPLHVLAMALVDRFRETFKDEWPVSFSAGIDRANFPDAAALGLAPITVCSDLLKPGGYGRMPFYFLDLAKRMDAVGATNLGDFVILSCDDAEGALVEAMGVVDGLASFKSATARRTLLSLAKVRSTKGITLETEGVRFARANPPPDCCDEHKISLNLKEASSGAFWMEWVRQAKLRNTKTYVKKLLEDPRYRAESNRKLPPKVGTKLELFNCITCDKCVPVCPNDANFTYPLPKTEVPVVKMRRADTGWTVERGATLVFDKKHQLANFADFCNECGNCDVFCPEDGGPYVMKPRFFGSRAQWEHWKARDGFFLERAEGEESVLGRFSGREFRLRVHGDRAHFSGEGFDVRFLEADPEKTIDGSAEGEVDLTFFHIMNWLRRALISPDAPVTYVNS
ncbi:MAG TPA: 4Fe-4S dicluster domain-containing protein, partial [bacterium]|nr:4Fe-4S dicluster domain-containing protein [bacterium]